MPTVHSGSGALVAIALLSALAVRAEAGDPTPIPRGATLSVSTEKQEYFLGEWVVLQVKLTNTDPLPFTIEPAIWSRGALRDECVTVAMTGADGRAAWDPFPESLGGGGPSPDPVTLRKGESWEEKVDLWLYGLPDRAGTWKVRVSRYFGWEETAERPNPSAEVVLRFREPTLDEAAKVLDDLATAGKEARFYSAAYPIFVPLLEKRAAAGLSAAAEGLALNRDPAATRALLRLFASKNRDVANVAGKHLVQRIRVPVKEGDGEGSRFRRMGRAYLHSLEDMVPAWRPEFEAEARVAARAFLEGEGLPVSGSAGVVLILLGTPEDGPAVTAGLDHFARLFEPKSPSGDPFKDRRELEEFERDDRRLYETAWALFHRGLRPAAKPESAGDALLWLESLSFGDGKERPADWMDTLRRLAAHPRALVRREVAMHCRGEGRDADLRALRETLAKDPDERVAKAAKGDR